jgi:hypothetical protein
MWEWTRVGRGCGAGRALTAGNCGLGNVCADIAPSGEPLCVYQSANLSDCTGAPKPYGIMHKYYLTASDHRVCNAGSCACANSSNANCSLQSAAWFNSSDPTCSSAGHPIDTSGACNMNLGGSQVVSIQTNITYGGSCLATGISSPGGFVTPDSASAITACCTN